MVRSVIDAPTTKASRAISLCGEGRRLRAGTVNLAARPLAEAHRGG